MVFLDGAGLVGVLLGPALQLALFYSCLKLGHFAVDLVVECRVQVFVFQLFLVLRDLLLTLLEIIVIFKGFPTTLIRLLCLRFLFG